MQLRSVALDDRYTAQDGAVVLNGTQALLVAMLRQRRLDRRRGYRTAGFLSGYRGSPLASLDSEAWQAAGHLAREDIRFVPGINEDLALTAVWGSQQVALDPNATVEGVFGLWYGKGAGLDRCGDALRHAHGAGASRRGGVLVVSGDDHALKSSSQAYHSEPTFIDMQMPVLYPADIQEMLDYAGHGWEMSRYSGCYVGLKVLAEHVNSTAVVDVGLHRLTAAEPEPLGPVNDRWIRWPDPWPDVELRLLEVKLPAALAYARANGLNRTVARAASPRLAIVTAGKSYLDLVQALGLLHLDLAAAASLGISIYKIGMPWPVDEAALRAFCRGHATVLVIEEKRDLLEAQVRTALYGQDEGAAPVVLGRANRRGERQFPMVGELGPLPILRALAPELSAHLDPDRRRLLNTLLLRAAEPRPAAIMARTPYFCSGCPHSTSTKVPDGSRALAGVGCHFMATGMERHTETFTQMGGEGVPWIGTAPFTRTGHVFVNLGEGTYFHSGSLAIRAALAAGVNVTYKILFNDAIAMTGGQPVEGEFSVPVLVRQLQAEGVRRIALVADDPARYAGVVLPSALAVRPREELDQVQRELREAPGVSVLIYDQVCATEKRRRRKRGTMAEAPRRVVINERVCEGCGDCSAKSNCLSVVPVETEFGRKRAIDQTSCNQDLSCVEGFCPSFVTVEGGLRKREPAPLPSGDLPEPPPLAIRPGATYDIVIAGVGGTGIVTVGAILGMAAHLEGKPFTIHDKLGMAQKYGAVNSHVRIAGSPEALGSVRIAERQARLMIGGDLGVCADPTLLGLLDRESARAVICTEQAVDGRFTRDPDLDFATPRLKAAVADVLDERADLLAARAIARAQLGDEIGAGLLMVGYAWQKGLLPLSEAAILKAIELNGAAVGLNRRAFALGRHYAAWPTAVAEPEAAGAPRWDEVMNRRTALLAAYQDDAYAARYRRQVEAVAVAERMAIGAAGDLAHAVALNLAKLMAYKDEYEVARLYTDGVFRTQVDEQFGPGTKLAFHLASPILARRDPVTGLPLKRRIGPWILPVLRLLARLRPLRGTPLDVFGYHPDRREERALIAQYETDMAAAAGALTAENHAAAVVLARLPETIRGYGHVKKRSIDAAAAKRLDLLARIKDERATPAVAAE
ncbi:indolepyruvate ferredoxin oxidoreductase family protein [Chelatococcus reniformis]|uniref:Indolepyruvate ferredoxin oxidoreductase n=1 Tax=Chelatococcus reniformis TaxID=1494448 RepID=A0A916UUE8_9HYPH|nr:indolepyruvate ferredoxin oxidoreductase family protein [Chelatococcus reniformis]GGC87265.1 indolepyruvate ferredoxin oxidoreductase [Chelatococcus reniformis]